MCINDFMILPFELSVFTIVGLMPSYMNHAQTRILIIYNHAQTSILIIELCNSITFVLLGMCGVLLHLFIFGLLSLKVLLGKFEDGCRSQHPYISYNNFRHRLSLLYSCSLNLISLFSSNTINQYYKSTYFGNYISGIARAIIFIFRF